MAILLNSFARVNAFCDIASMKCKGKITVESKSDDGTVYRVNGKSTMGMYSLDLSKPITVICSDESDQETITEALKFVA